MDFNALSEKLTPEEVEWRIQFGGAGDNTLVVPYITNRAIINRLNKVVGFDKWETELTPYTLTETQETRNKATGEVVQKTTTHAGFICKITIYTENGKVTRQDTASITDIEALKGGASDSMKRAAVQLGMGIELYSYPKIYITGKGHKHISDDKKARLSKAVEAFNNGQLTESSYVI